MARGDNVTDSENRADWSEDQWRRHALKLEAELKEISQPYKFRFTFEHRGKIWDRDVMILGRDHWPAAVRAADYLKSWFTMDHGSLVVAVRPLDVVSRSD